MPTTVVKPDLPSSVVRWTGEEAVQVTPTFNEIVAIVGPHDRGPVGEAKLYTSLAAWEADFGTGDSVSRTAVVGAFIGSGLPGTGGAGGVIFRRCATGAAASAVANVTNTTPATALHLTAISPGTWASDITWKIEDDSLDAAKDVLRIYYKGVEVEHFSYAQTNVAALAAAVNARPSRYVTAGSVITGVALTHTTGSLSGTAGNNGSTLTSTEYDDASRDLEFANFGIFFPAGLTDAAIKVQLGEWVKGQADEMRPVRAVFGGASGETLDDAISELSSNPSLRDEHIIRFAVGDWHDDVLDADLSTAEVGGRVAGALAARGERSALTNTKFAGLLPASGNGPTREELRAGAAAGLTMLHRISSAIADVAISWGVTTFISTTTPGKPFDLFSDPRIVGLLDRVLRHMVDWGNDVVVGDLPVTDDTRDLVRKELLKVGGDLERTGLALPGTFFASVEPPDDPTLADTIPYDFGWAVSRTTNFLVGSGRVR